METITTNTILYCREFESTVRFYRDALSLKPTHTTNWFVEFYLNQGSRLSVVDEKKASIQGKGPDRAGITIALQVEDIQSWWEKLHAKNLKPTRIKTHPWNANVFYFHDPQGHRIEIWQSTVES